MRYRLIQKPRLCPREAYERAAQAIAAHAGTFPAVRSVYRMGGVSAPGISDLDVVIVLHGGAAVPPFDFAAHLDADARYTLMHSAFVVPEVFWQNRNLFFTFNNLELLSGDTVEAAALPPAWLAARDRRLAYSHLTRIYLGLFAQLTAHLLKVRSLLCELHALRFDLDALRPGLPGASVAAFEGLTGDIDRTRRSWFNDLARSEAAFAGLCLRAKAMLADTMEALSEHPAPAPDGPQPDVLRLSAQRALLRGNGRVGESHSWTAHAAAWLAQLPLNDTLLRKVSGHLGRYAVQVPTAIYDVLTEVPKPHAGEGSFLEAQAAILSDPAVLSVRKHGYSFPALDLR